MGLYIKVAVWCDALTIHTVCEPGDATSHCKTKCSNKICLGTLRPIFELLSAISIGTEKKRLIGRMTTD